MYYLCSENKGSAADLGLCSSHMRKAGFLVTQFIRRDDNWHFDRNKGVLYNVCGFNLVGTILDLH